MEWWNIQPARENIIVNGHIPHYPDSSGEVVLDKMVNMSADYGKTYVVYIPKNSTGITIKLTHLRLKAYQAQWLNPRTGAFIKINDDQPINAGKSDEDVLPVRPDNEDWVVLLKN